MACWHTRPGSAGLATLLALLLSGHAGWAADGEAELADKPATRTAEVASAPAESGIALNLPETLELRVLADYISQRLDMTFVYAEDVGSQRVSVRTPGKLPTSALLPLLQSALQVKGMVLVDTEQPKLKKILTAGSLAAGAAATTRPAEGAPTTSAITQVFTLHAIDAAAADALIKPFLSQPGGNSVAVPSQKLLVVSDYLGNVERIADLLKRIEQPNSSLVTRTYRFRSISADRVDRLMKQLLEQTPDAGDYQSAADPQAGVLVVTATPQVHQRLESLKTDLDVPAAAQESPIQFYKLANTTATNVLRTIRAIEGRQSGSDQAEIEAPSLWRPNPGRSNPLTAGPSAAMALPTLGQAAITPAPETTASAAIPVQPARMRTMPTTNPAHATGETQAESTETPQPVHGAQARVAADINTNTIIVIGPPSAQQFYDHLIRTLDKRRPQVMVECILVTLDTSDNFSMAVDFAATGGWANNDTLVFSSFGISQIDTNTGRLKIIPGQGFNGALISSDIADVVVRALATHNRAKVVSAPRILVNDNATGTLTSIAESPYTSINTAVGTISTTTFAGYAQAGTEITLTPHISEADYLQLEYTVSLNTFTGAGSNGIPPPRQTDAVESQVTVPDGSTIVVGGLNRRNQSKNVQAIPILGEIPILEYLFSRRDIVNEQTTLFVFLRPTILRDDRFQDLKFLSKRDLRESGVGTDAPESEPIPMR